MSQCARFFGYELARWTLRTGLMNRRLIRSPRKRKQVVGYFDAERFARLEVVDNSNLVGCNSYHALRTRAFTPVVGCQFSAEATYAVQ
jgi:hypothetical protein